MASHTPDPTHLFSSPARESTTHVAPPHIGTKGSKKKTSPTRNPSRRRHLLHLPHHRHGPASNELVDWDEDGGAQAPRQPYHQYVHQLVRAGWDNLTDLERYLAGKGTGTGTGTTTNNNNGRLMVSILDVAADCTPRRWPDLTSELELGTFLAGADGHKGGAGDARVRLYMVEYDRVPPACVIEAFGHHLALDPRFFSWSINSSSHVFTPSQRHRAPYISLGFGILNQVNRRGTDSETFKVLVYIRPDDEGDGWTGLVLFSSSIRIRLSPNILNDPPHYKMPMPPPKQLKPKTIRELYLESFSYLDLTSVVASPFYAIANLLRLECFCWGDIIATIREEDRRVGGISETSVTHTEEIKKSLSIVTRGGSLGWHGQDESITKSCQADLKEDFEHLVDQTSLLWQTRDKLAAIHSKNSEARWTTLTNAFTYLFAPFTIITGIYGMNVIQISGDSANPSIWQPFVAVAALNFVMIVILAASKWVDLKLKHGRAAGAKEVLGFAVGTSMKQSHG